MVASGERASLVEMIGSLRLEYLKVRAMLSIERDRIDSIRWHMALSQEEFRQVRRDRDDTWRRLRRLESYVERHLGTDIAKISRKRSKPDKHGHGNGIECARARRMLSKGQPKSTHGQTKSSTKRQSPKFPNQSLKVNPIRKIIPKPERC
ncbi:hypothetical protein Tco_1392194 [Tanacetum coccineum]